MVSTSTHSHNPTRNTIIFSHSQPLRRTVYVCMYTLTTSFLTDISVRFHLVGHTHCRCTHTYAKHQPHGVGLEPIFAASTKRMRRDQPCSPTSQSSDSRCVRNMPCSHSIARHHVPTDEDTRITIDFKLIHALKFMPAMAHTCPRIYANDCLYARASSALTSNDLQYCQWCILHAYLIYPGANK